MRVVRLVGLTGGIAAGKSTVARRLAALGACVVDADALAREVVEPGSPALAEITESFGSGVLDASGRLDRAAMATAVFGDAEARRRLEAITHPRILGLVQERVSAALLGAAPVVVLDIPLLYENGLERLVEGVIVVWCDHDTEVARLRARDGIGVDEAETRIAAQMPVEEKRRRATWVIDNSGTPEATRGQVDAWWQAQAPAR